MEKDKKKKKSFGKTLLAFGYIIVFSAIAIISNVKFDGIMTLPDDFVASYSDVDTANKNGTFGSLVKATINSNQTKVDANGETKGEVVFKLLGFIPIKRVKVTLLPDEEVYVGGVPVGIAINSAGAIVVSDTVVENDEHGQPESYKNISLHNGDIIKKINGVEISSLDQIEQLLQEGGEKAEVEVIRKNTLKKVEVDLLKSEDKYKLGLWVRDDISGVGTLTFVGQDSSFGALGHPITEEHDGNIVPVGNGKLYNCSLVGITKGQKNNPGQLKCVFMQADDCGEIYSNGKYGVFGKLNNKDDLIDSNRTAYLGGRLGVTTGKAKIVSSVSGIREEYDIEIIKASYQSKSDDKSLVFKVTDQRLLDLTGGIVQGMSGSPIIQNGKIVGAVTHVFLSDPTKGYGVYTDWMIEATREQKIK